MSWQLLVDRGGTFTDVVARGPAGEVQIRKLLSRTEDGDATSRVAHEQEDLGHPVSELRLGTTVATNALLERTGESVTLLTTRGFADLLEIGNQDRPDIFALNVVKHLPLHEQVVEVDERIMSDGSVRVSPDVPALRKALQGLEHVAVLFLNAHVNPAHEQLVERVAREEGVKHITLSHKVTPEIGAVPRGQTTIADAYLTPILRRSVDAVSVDAARLLCMQSSGGLTGRRVFSGKDALLSGPAGGVVATREVARLAGFTNVIGLDMGGTSTDVCRCDEQLERVFETEIDGIHIRAPALNIVTVAAGGGSVCSLRDGRFLVGPESAGALPGPACYGRGGPATVTDCNLVLGRLRPEWFPHMELDMQAARTRLGEFGDPEASARGFLRVAVENMGAAIRSISVARGYDPRDHALCAFGGAGPQHGCELARTLGIRHVLIHPMAGVLSAWGLGQADVSRHALRQLKQPVRPHAFPLEDSDFPIAEARSALESRVDARDEIQILLTVDLRYVGVDATLNVPWSEQWRTDFEARHQQLFGFIQADREVEIVATRVDAVSLSASPHAAAKPCVPHDVQPDDNSGPLPLFIRARLAPGSRLQGPALIVEDCATTVVEEGWLARVDGRGLLILEDQAPSLRLAREAPTDATTDAATGTTDGDPPDPVSLEVFSNRFMSIATQMGEHLQRVAHSTNIKERLDFSCALFDAQGRLVANAPHIPVHLGAVGETVRGLLARQDLRDGDAWLSNDPYGGGSHLPDLTVVTPVFREGRLAFLVANRGHHADVGGITPGSMPPDSTHIDQEGALFQDVLILRDGELRESELSERLLAAGARGLDERLGDLRAQVACNVAGASLLHELCNQEGTALVQAWMAHVEDNAADVMSGVVAGLESGSFQDELDDGSRLCVDIRIDGNKAVVDFAGTSPQQAGNRNAPRAVTRAAVLYAFRTLAKRSIPLNEGCLRPLDIRIPPGSLLDPRYPAAVVGGNVETSQRVVDVLFGALGKLAASQGTMNNLTLGTESFGYYETICGGAGAGYGFDGASAVHTHMTNTRITDPEILEQRYPVLVKRFEVRRGSGGHGVWRGGDGVLRELEFLQDLDASLLVERRRTRPFGLRAEAGAAGKDLLSRRGACIATPGGGGYSPSESEWARMPIEMARQLFRAGRWKGPTQGIAVGASRACVWLIPAADAEAVCAELGPSLLHRCAPGTTHLHDACGDLDLATDAPRYIAPVRAGIEPERPMEESTLQLDVTEGQVALLVAPGTPVDPRVLWTSAPAHDLLMSP